jgi:predicted permease
MSTRLRGIPGVEEVGGTTNLPLTGFHPDGTYIMMSPGETLPSNMQMLEQMFHDRSRTGYAEYSAVSNGYFRVLAIPLLRGRLFDARDTMTAPHVALISESLAQEKWPHEDPLGHQLEFGNMDGDLHLLTVVGVVGDVRADNLEHAAFPTIYVDYRQRPQATSSLKLVMRGSGDVSSVIAAARQIVRELDPEIPPKFATLDQVVSGSVQGRRFNVTLLGVFAGTALLLALAGMYGVMAYSVTRRTNEIGVRMALGASRTKILRLVLEQGLMTAAIGIAVGIVASVAVTRTISSLLFGLSAMDPVTFVGVGLLLAAVALLASYIPARRAAKVDPMVALRYE